MTQEVTEAVVGVASVTQEALSKALEYIERTESFVVEQAPLLVQEVLNYGFVFHLFWTLFSLFFVVGIGYGIYKWIRAWVKSDVFDKDGYIPIMIGLFGVGIPLAFLCENMFVLAKIVVAPRLYLLSELSTFIK